MSEHQSCSSEPEHFIKDQAHRDRISPSGGKTSVAQSSSGSEEGVTMAEAIAKLREFDRLGLIIESAVRNADGPNWVTVSDLIKRNRVFMSLVGSGCAAQGVLDRGDVARIICCGSTGCQFVGDSEDGSKCYCDTSDFHGSGVERKTGAILALSAVTPSPAQGAPDQRCLEDMTLAHNARKTAIEECARVAEKFPIQIYNEDHSPLRRSCKPSTFEDIADAIRALSAVTPSPGAGAWTPDQFWEYVGGLAGEFEAGQMRDMLAAKGLSITSTDQQCPECEANGLCARHAVTSTDKSGAA